MAMKVFVTGADGFIGSHLVERLVREGYPVRALALYNALGSRGWLDHIDPAVAADVDIVHGDVRDAAQLVELMRGCDRVLHLAALIGIPYSYQAPGSYVETNVIGTLNVLQAARQLNFTRVVHTSTSEVYGSAQRVPIAETHPLNAQSPYAASKIGADQMALSFHAAYGLPVTVLRPFNTFGPRQSARAVIPAVITQIAAGRRGIHLGSTTPTRDFSYVDDTVSGFLAALRSDRAVGRTINLGSGHEISIGALATLIGEIMDARITIHTDADRVRPAQSEVTRLLADNSLAMNVLGWVPECAGEAGLRRALERTIAWFRIPDNRAGYRASAYVL